MPKKQYSLWSLIDAIQISRSIKIKMVRAMERLGKASQAFPIQFKSVSPGVGVEKKNIALRKHGFLGPKMKSGMTKGGVEVLKHLPLGIKKKGLLTDQIDDEELAVWTHVKVLYLGY